MGECGDGIEKQKLKRKRKTLSRLLLCFVGHPSTSLRREIARLRVSATDDLKLVVCRRTISTESLVRANHVFVHKIGTFVGNKVNGDAEHGHKVLVLGAGVAALLALSAQRVAGVDLCRAIL
jgi:hypothetical protein